MIFVHQWITIRIINPLFISQFVCGEVVISVEIEGVDFFRFGIEELGVGG
jgi:hypothetical protein